MSGSDRAKSLTSDAADGWIRERLAPREARAVAYVSHLLSQVRALPKFASSEAVADLDRVVWFACFDSFFMSVRVLSEYFVRMPSRDRTARDLLESWEPPDGDAAKRLGDDHWLVSSRHVAHLSKHLIPDNADDVAVIDLAEASMRRIVDDVDEVVSAFVSAYLASDNPVHARQVAQLQRRLQNPSDSALAEVSCHTSATHRDPIGR